MSNTNNNIPDPLEGENLVLALSRAVDAATAGIGRPVWTPLEAVIPFAWCGAFMFMGAAKSKVVMGSPSGNGDRMIFSYKHGITRRYLHIGEDLQAYTYRSDLCDIGDPTYTWEPMDKAIEHAFEGIEDLDADRTTKYDDRYIADRNARLVAAGYKVVSS